MEVFIGVEGWKGELTLAANDPVLISLACLF